MVMIGEIGIKMSNNNDLQAFDNMRTMIWFFAGVCIAFMLFNEYNTVKDSMLQSALEAEYAYDYACSPSSQIIKKTEFGRNVYVSKTLWVYCGGLEQGLGNFVRPSHVEKKLPNTNSYGADSVLPALLTI